MADDIEKFRSGIDTTLQNLPMSEKNINQLNDQITKPIEESQEIYCPKNKKDERITKQTKILLEERSMRSSSETWYRATARNK